MGEEEPTQDEEPDSDSLTFSVDFRPGELLMVYQMLSTAEMYLEREEMDEYSLIAGALSRKVLFTMLDEDFKNAVSNEVENLNDVLDTSGSNPLSFQ